MGDHNDQGVLAEDLVPGYVTELGSHTLTEEEIVLFGRQWDPQFFHVDVERAASRGHFGGIIASGLHTLGIYQRLAVLARGDDARVIAGAGMEGVWFHRPVRPSDTLTGHSVIERVEPQPAKRRVLVSYGGRLTNQRHEVVLTVRLSAYLRLGAA